MDTGSYSLYYIKIIRKVKNLILKRYDKKELDR
jgi:hypothetical protein